MTPPDTIRAASGNVVETGVSVLRRTHEVLALALGFASLGMGCIVYSACMLPLSLLVRGQWGRVAGRRLATGGFRVYLFWLSVIGVGRFDLKALDVLRGDGALIIASGLYIALLASRGSHATTAA